MDAGVKMEFVCKDHPEANGRRARPGEHAYQLLFPLDNGDDLVIHCGDETMTRFSDMLGCLILDSDAEAAT
jgi:hypothetical protein